MKVFQSILAVGVVVVVAALAYEHLISQTLHTRVGTSERRLDGVEKDNLVQAEALKKHQEEITGHSQALKARGEEIAGVEKRIALAEARIAELSRAADRDRAEVEKLRSAVSGLNGRNSDFDRSRRELEELSRELKKSLERDADFARRLLSIERQLGVERPRP